MLDSSKSQACVILDFYFEVKRQGASYKHIYWSNLMFNQQATPIWSWFGVEIKIQCFTLKTYLVAVMFC